MSIQQTTVVILHGWSLEKELKQRWRPLMKLLEDVGVQVKYLPLPGFEHPLEKSWNLNDYRDYVIDQIKDLNDVFLMGHSFGGQVALRVAASSLSKLSGLVLIAPSGIIDRSWFKQAKRGCFRLVAKLGSGLLKLFGQKKGSTLHNFFQKQLYFFVQEKDYLEATSILKETMTKVLMDEIIDDLPQITVPALIFWGDRDSFTPVKHAALVTSLIPRAQLKLMRGEGHRPYYTQPEFIAENVINFIHDNAI